jgi:hypothetical protein
MFIERAKLVVATSTNRQYAKKLWHTVKEMAEQNPYLLEELPENYCILSTGDEEFWNIHGSHFRFAATNQKAARSLTVERAFVDEIREHKDFSAWGAITNAGNAIQDAQFVAVSNQGDVNAVVLDSLRNPAIEYIETGKNDYRLGLFEWSMPDGSDVTDLHSLAMSNPDLGNRTDPEVLLGAARRAKAAGGEELASFKTEVGCMRVHLLDPAIDPDKWDSSGTDNPVDLAEHRKRVCLCVDVALDGSHASLLAAAVLKDGIHVEVIKSWDGYGCIELLKRDLQGLVDKVRPRKFGWWPNGPAAAINAEIKDRGYRGWPPRGVEVEEIKTEAPAACMGLSAEVWAGNLHHPRDNMLTHHVKAAQKLIRGDTWVYRRGNAGPIDGTYALAGAVHLAKTLPPPKPELYVG